MDRAEFWQLLDGTLGHEDRHDRLTALLANYTPEQLIQFRLHYDAVLQEASTVDLWAVAHVSHGQCDDETFHNFREALIELGRPIFEQAVAHPDSLADYLTPGAPFVGMDNLGWPVVTAWTTKTGQSDDDFFTEVDRLDQRPLLGIEQGDWWSFNDPAEVRHRLPKIAAKFLLESE